MASLIAPTKLLTHWPRPKCPLGPLCVLSSTDLVDTEAALGVSLVLWGWQMWGLIFFFKIFSFGSYLGPLILGSAEVGFSRDFFRSNNCCLLTVLLAPSCLKTVWCIHWCPCDGQQWQITWTYGCPEFYFDLRDDLLTTPSYPWEWGEFATSSSLELFGTLPNLLQCSPIYTYQQLLVLIQPSTLAAWGLVIITRQPQPSITNSVCFVPEHELIRLITCDALRHHGTTKHYRFICKGQFAFGYFASDFIRSRSVWLNLSQ